jgi:cytoskeletal protein CcmA (bactofilin family)
MHPSGRIVGNVQTPAIKIELGAVLDGNCSMTERDSKKAINLVKGEKK